MDITINYHQYGYKWIFTGTITSGHFIPQKNVDFTSREGGRQSRRVSFYSGLQVDELSYDGMYYGVIYTLYLGELKSILLLQLDGRLELLQMCPFG